MIFKIYFLISLILAKPAIWVDGKIISYDQKTITLQQNHGAFVKVPRSSYKKSKGIIVGKENVRVEVSPSEFMRLNPKATAGK